MQFKSYSNFHILNVFVLFCLCSFCYFLLVLFLPPFGFVIFWGNLRMQKTPSKTRNQRKRESAAAVEEAPQGVLAVDRHHGARKPIVFVWVHSC